MRILHAQGFNWAAFGYFIESALREIVKRGHKVVLARRTDGKERMKRDLDQFDVIFCDWISNRAKAYSCLEPSRAKLVIRGHDGDFGNRQLCQAINWSNVALLMFPSPATYRTLYNIASDARTVPKAFVGNPIDTDHFVFDERRQYSYTIGMLGAVRRRKANLLAAQWFRMLIQQSPDWSLEMRGWLPQGYGLEVQTEAAGLPISLVPKGPNGLLEWFGHHSIMLSSSYREAFHVGPMEGMATGCYPIVRKRAGARWVFPEWSIVQTGEDFVTKCLAWEEMALSEKHEWSQRAREWVLENHSVPRFVDRFLEAIENCEQIGRSGVATRNGLSLALADGIAASQSDSHESVA